MLAHERLAVGRGVEGDVDYGFEVYRGALFGGGAEFPLAEACHSVGIGAARRCRAPVECCRPCRRCESTAYSTTSPSTCSLIRVGGYFGSIFLKGPGAENPRGSRPRTIGIHAQLGKIQNPATRGAVQIGHVYEHLVDLFRGEDLLGLRASRERGEIRRPGSLGCIVELGVRIGLGDQRVRSGSADFRRSAEAGNFRC